MRVHHLSCGTMCPRGGGWVDGRSGSVLGSARLICHVLLVETPASGLVLVDTGIGLDDIARPRERLGRWFTAAAGAALDEGEAAARQVEALGFARGDVRHIVVTHMDLDHAGGLADFPDATVHLFRDEHRAAMDRPTRLERERYRPVHWAHGPRFEVYDADGEPWRGFRAARDLRGLPPELLLVPLTGHSRGHSGVCVESERGWLMHAGDAYFHEDQMRPAAPRCPPGLALFQRLAAFDGDAMRRNQDRLRELVRGHGDEVTVFSAHDVAELERLLG